MSTLSMFGAHKPRKTIAVYPDGTRHHVRKVDGSWQYHPRGSAARPFSVALAEARDEGATIVREG